MHKKLLIMTMATMLMAVLVLPVLAANTVNVKGNIIEISNIDSDWIWSTDFTTAINPDYAYGVRTIAIIFIPGATDDKLSIKWASATGPELFPSTKCMDEYDPKQINYAGERMKLFLDYSDGMFSAGSKVIIILRLDPGNWQ